MSTAATSILDLVDERTVELIERRRGVKPHQRRGWIIRRALLSADVVGLSLAFLLAEVLYGPGASGGNRLGQGREYVAFALALPCWVFAAKLYGLYDRDEERTDYSTADDFAGVFHLVTITAWALFAFGHLTRIANPELSKVVLFWIMAVIFVSLARGCGRAYCRSRIEYLQNTVIVGAGEVGQRVALKLLNHPEYGLNLVGFIDAWPREQDPALAHVALLGEPAHLPEIVVALDVERVIFAFSAEDDHSLLDLTRTLNEMDVQVDVVPRLFEVVGTSATVHAVEGLPMLGLPPFRLPRSSAWVKRGMDVVLATAALIVLAPVFGVIAILIKVDTAGPIFFRQPRVSRDGVFRIWKFRTMTADAEQRKDAIRHLNTHAMVTTGDTRMFKVADDPRTTRVGRILRRTSVDELPQLLNVLRGEMSLVGPRPLILEEDQHVVDWARRRLALRPGITGLWQVLGRSDIGFGEMVRLDYVYVTTWSLLGDVQLIIRTVPALLRSRKAA